MEKRVQEKKGKRNIKFDIVQREYQEKSCGSG